jgi:streptogramin lyase
VADDQNHAIRRIAPDGTVSTLAGKAGEPGHVDGVGGEARFNGPRGVAVDASGRVYVGEADAMTIRRIAPDGTVTTLAPRLTGNAWDMVVDAAGDLWVVDVNASRTVSWLRRVAPDGTMATLDITGPGAGRISDIWTDPSGTVYGTAALDSTTIRVTQEGVLTILAGGREIGMADGPGDLATFDGPLGIVGDPSGVLYVVDAGNATIRTVTCR